MIILSATAKKLTLGSELDRTISSKEVKRARQLVQAIQDLISSIEIWTSEIADEWRPKTLDSHYISEMYYSSKFSIPRLTCPRLLSYHDIWLASIWNFHVASQIVLRESLVDVINYVTARNMQEPGLTDMKRIQSEQNAVKKTVYHPHPVSPSALGLRTQRHSRAIFPAQGKMTGRFFALFPMRVMQRARFTQVELKQTASEVIEWINSSHGLE
ncbi:hypothetical protein V1525DRAFT_73587 [Lipomyces kononenkoae]|uniref:Uncharacterized protein n=1 Tax=Lipomyces kononenkoae TaxID=34357 RepID=A0ACC3SRJ0_LIPKO